MRKNIKLNLNGFDGLGHQDKVDIIALIILNDLRGQKNKTIKCEGDIFPRRLRKRNTFYFCFICSQGSLPTVGLGEPSLMNL